MKAYQVSRGAHVRGFGPPEEIVRILPRSLDNHKMYRGDNT
jgi:hypothetical protein